MQTSGWRLAVTGCFVNLGGTWVYYMRMKGMGKREILFMRLATGGQLG